MFSSEDESEGGCTRVEESSRWIAEMKGGAEEAGPGGQRDANGEDFVRGVTAMLEALAGRSGGGEPTAPHKALERRQRTL